MLGEGAYLGRCHLGNRQSKIIPHSLSSLDCCWSNVVFVIVSISNSLAWNEFLYDLPKQRGRSDLVGEGLRLNIFDRG